MTPCIYEKYLAPDDGGFEGTVIRHRVRKGNRILRAHTPPHSKASPGHGLVSGKGTKTEPATPHRTDPGAAGRGNRAGVRDALRADKESKGQCQERDV